MTVVEQGCCEYFNMWVILSGVFISVVKVNSIQVSPGFMPRSVITLLAHGPEEPYTPLEPLRPSASLITIIARGAEDIYRRIYNR